MTGRNPNFHPGRMLKVVDVTGLSKDLAKALRAGAYVECLAVSPTGNVMTTAHPGWFKPHRFSVD